MRRIEVPVLIVGGGGCGLSSQIFLANLGVEALLIERHPAPAIVPKARYLNQRAMEIFRQHGVADAIYAVGAPLKSISRMRWSTSLGGDGPYDRRTFFALDSFGGGGLTDYAEDSPCLSTLYPQVRLEPLLRDQAEARAPGKLLYHHELIGFAQDVDGVTARVRERDSGQDIEIRCAYMIAADGGKTVGPALGVELNGIKDLVDVVTIYFKADLSEWVDDDEAMTTWFANPEGEGSWSSGVLGKLGPNSYDRYSREWMFHFSFRTDDPARNDEDLLVPRMRELLKIPDLEIEVMRINHWIVEGVIADKHRVGRVFLAGDAAHKHPPTTGLGLNSAIEDAHNLCWKLKAVLDGTASDAMLDSYESERRPAAQRNIDWALLTFQNHQFTHTAIGLVPGSPEISHANFAAMFADDDNGRIRRARMAHIMNVHRMEFQAHDLELGYHYDVGALAPDSSDPPERDPMGRHYKATTRPGHRLPHAWLSSADGELSTHDLVAPGGYALLIGARGAPWASAMETVVADLGLQITVATIGEGGEHGDRDGRWAALREVGDDGAVLVRPDQHVGWRATGMADDPEAALRGAFREILKHA
jgi:2,4-dichlorophenol 6-monooxygenase